MDKNYIEFYKKGIDYFNQYDYKNAIELFNQTKKKLGHIDNYNVKIMYAEIFYNISVCLINLNDYDKSLENLKIANEFIKNTNEFIKKNIDTNILDYRILFSIGVCNYKLKRYDISVEYFIKTLKYKEESFFEVVTLWYIADCYSFFEFFELAQTYLEEAIKRKYDDYYKIGLIYINLKNYELAIENFIKIKDKFDKKRNFLLAESYKYNNNYVNAIIYYQILLNKIDKIDKIILESIDISNIYSSLSYCYSKLSLIDNNLIINSEIIEKIRKFLQDEDEDEHKSESDKKS